MTYVKTKKQLEEAVKRKDKEIIVVGELAEKLKGFAKLQELSSTKMAKLLAFLAGAGLIAAASIIAAAPTSGLSLPAGAMAFVAAAPAYGVSTGTASIAVVLIVASGLATCVALLNDYTVDIGFNLTTKDAELHFTKKENY